jgi:hypothetical protein
MQFRLRTLLILLTFLGVLFARIGYLKRMASFHRQLAEGRIAKTVDRAAAYPDNVSRGADRKLIETTLRGEINHDPASRWKEIREASKTGAKRDAFTDLYFHLTMADRYERAIYRPWKLVSETESE